MNNNNFFNDMQNQWMKNFNAIDFNEWMKNMQAQNIHLCGLECNDVAQHTMDVAKANAHLMQDNMEQCIEGVQNNMKANSLDAVIANNHQVMQNMIFNTANFSKQMMDKVANFGIDFYEHYVDAAMNQFNQNNAQSNDPGNNQNEDQKQGKKKK
jgi:hypothetical protein